MAIFATLVLWYPIYTQSTINFSNTVEVLFLKIYNSLSLSKIRSTLKCISCKSMYQYLYFNIIFTINIQAKRVLDTRAADFIESFLASWSKVVTSKEEMELVDIQSTEKDFRMRISQSSMDLQVRFKHAEVAWPSKHFTEITEQMFKDPLGRLTVKWSVISRCLNKT